MECEGEEHELEAGGLWVGVGLGEGEAGLAS